METITTAREATLRQREMMRKRRAVPQEVFGTQGDYTGISQVGQSAFQTEIAYSHNKGEPYAATRPIAQRIAGQPIHVAEVVNSENDARGEKAWRPAKKGRRRLSLEEMAKLPRWVRDRLKLPTTNDVGECVKSIKSMHSAAVRVDILEQHPVLDLMNNPNPRMNGHTLLDNSVVSLMFTGKLFWWLTQGRKRPYDMWYIPAHRMVDPEDNIMLERPFQVIPKNGAQSNAVEIPAKYMIYCYHPDPADPMKAMAPIRACLQNVRVGEAITTSQEYAFNNMMQPDLAVVTGDIIDPSGKNLGKAQMDRFQINELNARLGQQHVGPTKSRKPIIMDRAIDKIIPITMKPNEMDWLESYDCNTEAIWASIGTPPVVAGRIKDANRATALVAEESFAINVLNPRAVMLSVVMNDRLLPLFNESNEDLIMWMEEPVSSDKDMQLKENTLLIGKRGMTVDELRQELGRPPLPNNKGEVLISSATDIYEPLDDGDDEIVQYREDFMEDQAQAGKPPQAPKPVSGAGPQKPPPSADETATGKEFDPILDPVVKMFGDYLDEESSVKAGDEVRSSAFLKVHGRQEKSFARDIRKFLDAQVKHICKQLAEGKEPFNPREWDKGLWRLAEPHLKRCAMTGATQQVQSANLRSHELITKEDEIPAEVQQPQITDMMLIGIRDYLAEMRRSNFWMAINNTTADRLATQLQVSLESGDTIVETVKRVKQALGLQSGPRALIIARSETTGALCSGQYVSYQDMKSRGIVSNLAWFANDDPYTRPAHWAANGQQQDANGMFTVGGVACRYPCDPNLPAELRCNCRCSTYTIQGTP